MDWTFIKQLVRIVFFKEMAWVGDMVTFSYSELFAYYFAHLDLISLQLSFVACISQRFSLCVVHLRKPWDGHLGYTHFTSVPLQTMIQLRLLVFILGIEITLSP